MRVAYRRDCIKLRNRSNLNKAVGRVPAAFVLLISWCSRVELFDGRHDFLTSLHTGIYHYCLTTMMMVTSAKE